MNNMTLYQIIEKMQYDNFGTFIRKEREKLGLTLNQFCFDNEIEPAMLSRIENSKQDIKLGALYKIAKGFNMTPAELLTKFEKA